MKLNNYTVYLCLWMPRTSNSNDITNTTQRDNYYLGRKHGAGDDMVFLNNKPLAYTRGYADGLKIYKLRLALEGLYNG